MRFFQFADRHPDILKVSSEEVKIPYLNPVTRKFTYYYPDFLIKTKKKTILIEIKPSSQCKPPNINKRKKTKRLITETQTWAINEAKWLAAKEWCDDRKIEFKILTEKEIDGV